MSEKQKTVFRVYNDIEHLLISASTVTGYVCTFGVASSTGIPIVIESSGIELKTCALSAGIKKI